MNIFDFTTHFGDEESCRTHFKEERDKQGIICGKCGHEHHSLRSGTVMQGSNLSFLIWYKTMFLMSVTKKGFSSKEMQKQLGLKRYEPVWYMVHKLRKLQVSKM